MFRGSIFDRGAERLAYLVEGHKAIPNNENILLVFKENVLQMYSQDQSKSISATSEFFYENFDGHEIIGAPICTLVDVDKLFNVVSCLSKAFESFTIRYSESEKKMKFKVNREG